MVVQNQTTIQPSDYQVSLEEGSTPPQLSTETVRYWSDFNRVYYHPRSIVQINDYELGSTLMPFEKWENGEALFAGLDREVDLLDRDIRFFAEECDAMQGIQVFAGADDAWGGFAARYVESLRDDYGKSSIWIWGLEEEENKGQRVSRFWVQLPDCHMANGMFRANNLFEKSTQRGQCTSSQGRLQCISQYRYRQQGYRRT